jgi:hypothetical protein
MSGTRGGSQSFGIRLSIDGAEAVESGLRRVQATANTAATSIEQTGQTTGRALAVIERGTDAASAGLRRMGGDFAALAPLVDGAGGAIGRLATSLGSGAGLLGVLGAVGGAVGAAVALYQNWDTVTRAVGGAVDFLTGRVRANAEAITSANAILREYIALGATAAQTANQNFIRQNRERAERAAGQIPAAERNVQVAEQALEAARGGMTPAQLRALRTGPGGAALSEESEAQLQRDLARAAERQTGNEAAQQRIRAAESDLNRRRAELAALRAGIAGDEGRIAGALADQSNTNPGRLPETPPATTPRGGGGGGRAAPRDDLGSRRDAFLVQNDPLARYQQRLEAIGQLQADLAASGQSPLPDEAVVRATEQAMQDYQRAVEGTANATRDAADGSKEWQMASAAAAKALSGAFEDLVIEGQSFDDVLKNLERSLLRIGNRAFLEPLIQQLMQLATGTGGGKGAGGGMGGAGGILGALAGLIGGGGAAAGGAKLSIDAAMAAGTLVSVAHDGWLVGAPGVTTRAVPMSLFADAPRFHSGGMIGPDERPVIAQVGERILNRAETAAYNRGGGITVNITTPDAGSFRNSEGQIMSKMAAALARSGRNR